MLTGPGRVRQETAEGQADGVREATCGGGSHGRRGGSERRGSRCEGQDGQGIRVRRGLWSQSSAFLGGGERGALRVGGSVGFVARRRAASGAPGVLVVIDSS